MKKKALALAAVCLTVGSMASACSSSGSKSAATSGGAASSAGGTSSSAGAPSSIKLAYSQPATDPYQNAEQQGVIGQYKTLGYKYLPATNAGGSAAQQLTDVESLINQGAKGIVMSVLDANAIIPAIKYANKHNVPIVPIDEAPAGGKVTMIVRADNVNMGKLACEQMGKLVPAGKAVLTLDGDPTSSNGRDRTNGFNDCMSKQFPKVTLYHVATKWSAATASSGLQTAFNQHKDINGVYVQSDTTFYPTVLQTLKKIGKTATVGQPGHVAIVSVDGGPAALNAIRAGIQDAVVEQPLLDYIKYGVQYITEALAGKTFTTGKTDHNSTITTYEGNLVDLLPTPVITKANVDSGVAWANQPFAKKAFAS